MNFTFEDGVRLEQLILDVLELSGVASDGCYILHDQLARLGLAGPALASEDDHLVLAPVPHGVPGPVRQRVTGQRAGEAGRGGAAVFTHMWGGSCCRQWDR